MFFKKGNSGGYFKKATDSGHIGIKAFVHPATPTLSIFNPNSTATNKVSGVLQKIK